MPALARWHSSDNISCGPRFGRDLLATDVLPFLKDVAYATRINVKTSRDSILEFAIPMAKPNLNSIIKGQHVARFFIIVH
jgi:hypothetical protein